MFQLRFLIEDTVYKPRFTALSEPPGNRGRAEEGDQNKPSPFIEDE